MKNRLLRYANWVANFGKTFDEFDSPVNDSRSNTAKETILILSMLTSPVIGSVLATWITQDLLGYSFTLIAVIGLVISFVFSTILQVRWLRLKLSAYKIFVGMLTTIAIELVIIGFLIASRQIPATYIIVDSTENSLEQYAGIINFIRVASDMQSPNTIAGLRVFGGNLSDSTDCDDTIQLIPPTATREYNAKLNATLHTLEPRGHASLTIAVSRALRQDLMNIKGPIKLIVITAKLDPYCDPQNSLIFADIAEDIKKTSRKDIAIVILSVGELSGEEMETFNQYASAYQGTHINALVPESIPALLLAPPSYFNNYTSQQTTTPGP